MASAKQPATWEKELPDWSAVAAIDRLATAIARRVVHWTCKPSDEDDRARYVRHWAVFERPVREDFALVSINRALLWMSNFAPGFALKAEDAIAALEGAFEAFAERRLDEDGMIVVLEEQASRLRGIAEMLPVEKPEPAKAEKGQRGPKSRVSLKELNIRLRDALKNPRLRKSSRVLAKKIGCAPSTVLKLPAYQAVQEERRHKEGAKASVPRAVGPTETIPTLRTPGVIARELGVPLGRVLYVLASRPHIKASARAGVLRLFNNHAVAQVRHELNAIAARRHSRSTTD